MGSVRNRNRDCTGTPRTASDHAALVRPHPGSQPRIWLAFVRLYRESSLLQSPTGCCESSSRHDMTRVSLNCKNLQRLVPEERAKISMHAIVTEAFHWIKSVQCNSHQCTAHSCPFTAFSEIIKYNQFDSRRPPEAQNSSCT